MSKKTEFDCVGSKSKYKKYRNPISKFLKYEKDIISGKIPCPFTVEFKVDGEVVCDHPLPLFPKGNPKIKLFNYD